MRFYETLFWFQSGATSYDNNERLLLIRCLVENLGIDSICMKRSIDFQKRRSVAPTNDYQEVFNKLVDQKKEASVSIVPIFSLLLF